MSNELIQTLEALPWSPYREITTAQGPMRVKQMTPTPKVWDLWNHGARELMKQNGYVLQRNKEGTWVFYRWVKALSDRVKDRLLKESRAEDSDHPLMVPPGLKYRPFQRAGIKYGIDRLFGQHGHRQRQAILIGDEPGLGKTIQAIGIMNQDPNLRDLRALIVCPASLKLNWRNELRKWMLEGIGSEAIVVKDKWPGGLAPGKILIVNYDILHRWEKEIRQTRWDYIVLDEAHYLKSRKARRTVYALGGTLEVGEMKLIKLITPIPCEKKIFLTGTPIPNKVIECLPIVKECDPEGLGANEAIFVRQYCVPGKNGGPNDNLEELQERMRAAFMVRRLKADVLKELPPKIRTVNTLDPSDYKLDRIFNEEMSIFQDYQELLRTWQIRAELAKAEGIEAHRIVLREKKLKLGISASMLSAIRIKTAIAKVPGVIDQVKLVHEDGKKVILFAHHIQVLDKLQEELEAGGLTFVRIDGSTSLKARQEAVEKFQAGLVDVFLGGIIPAGVGLTLTAAEYVIFAELDWVPGQMTQAEDRAHRIGQLAVVFILHVVMEGSLDEYMAKRLIEKQEIIERALDTLATPKDDDIGTEEDLDEDRDSFAAKEKAASRGTSAKKLQEEAERLTPAMRIAAETAIRIIQAKAPKDVNSVDKEILLGLLDTRNDLTALQLALGRKIAWKHRAHLDQDMVKDLKWPEEEK
jgi:SWI/SNF-related matrix-associated actin-dependent regulator 1 of chromatin subfamily A